MPFVFDFADPLTTISVAPHPPHHHHHLQVRNTVARLTGPTNAQSQSLKTPARDSKPQMKDHKSPQDSQSKS